jgi:hypothetical protein
VEEGGVIPPANFPRYAGRRRAYLTMPLVTPCACMVSHWPSRRG